ncbi:hypothetical protein FS837_000217 [Tulasnella sp. UAMH 9824]|nr:hypothetical protein FS837_000217 [Tulasnella sp. UAMH 9824]
MDETAAVAQHTASSESDTSVLRDLHGRQLNNVNDVSLTPLGPIRSLTASQSYRLPADLAERDRLDLQHEMLKSAIGGLYLPREAVQIALSPRADGTVPKVLDVGTGSGKWVTDMAKEFPHAEVVGLDLAPVNPSSTAPPNCRFILGDCNTCLDDPSYESAYDMIQARCIVTGVLDYRKFIQYIWKSLKPGGVFFATEGRMGSWDEHHEKLKIGAEGDPEYSWNNLVSLVGEAMADRNDQITYLDDIPAWLNAMKDAWEDVGEKPLWIPVASPELVFQGEAMRQNCLKYTESAQPLLLLQGHPKESVEKWAQNARKEMEELPFKQWAKVNPVTKASLKSTC